MNGQTISHYQVVSRLGGGGMGVVYQARDLRLDRLVALKVLPPELTRDAEAKARFMQEAKAASGLDHPNICTVYDIDETPDGQLFLVLAYYPGETLKQQIARGPLALDTALDLATQIAQGLQKAHAAAIVHRDIKPANVMVTPEGVAKIVDFGLAKLVDATGLTRPGTTLGTVAYMSPEQTRGEAVDARTDLWALGVVLYEMVAGRVPFGGDSAGAIAAAIQQQTPAPLTAIRSGVPLELDHVVARALARDRSERFQTAADLVAELKRLRRASDAAVVASAPPAGAGTRAPRSRKVAWALAGVVAAGAVATALLWPRSTTTANLPRFVNPVQVTNAIGVEDYPTWSPDGRTLAYAATEGADLISGNWDIWVTQVGGGPPVNRTADHPGDDRYPVWSPDGTQIAFWSSREGSGYFVMPALGGAPRKIIDRPAATGDFASRPAWSLDGTAVDAFVGSSTSAAIVTTSLRSGESTRREVPGIGNAMDLAWSPQRDRVAFVDAPVVTAQVDRLHTFAPGAHAAPAVTDGGTSAWSPSWSADGRTLYFVQNRGGTMDLWQQPLTREGAPEGDPSALTTGAEMRQAVFSPDGRRLAYSKGRRVGNVWRVPIRRDRPATWADAEQVTFDHAFIEMIDVSPDGTRLLAQSDRSGNPDLWMLPVTGGDMRQVTADPTPDWNPRWSPDGQSVAYYAYRSGGREIWVQSLAGGPARQLSRTGGLSVNPAWSPDGRRVAFTFASTSMAIVDDYKIGVVAVEGGEVRVLSPDGDQRRMQWSPDGRWVTFVSTRSPENRLWRMPAQGGPAEMVSGGSAYSHRWSPDGSHIYLTGVSERAGTIWELTADGTRERPATDLRGRRGYLEPLSLATDGRYLYFTWGEDLSDIWVMDVVRE